MNNLTMRLLAANEQHLILPLWQVCFPDYWEQLAVAEGRIPYEEICFAAFDGEKAVAHCGIIPYEIWCGGKVCRMGGIASVATLPEYRKRGIAAGLCEFAARWAQENGFDSLPLYTGFFRVYEAAQWRKLDVPETWSVRADGGSLPWKNGDGLSDAEKAEIISLYDSGENFDGKVLRQDSGTLHSWGRIFAEPEFVFAKVPGAYAVKSGNVVIETGFDPAWSFADKYRFFTALGDGSKVECFLPPTADNNQLLAASDLRISGCDAMHGERPMVRDLGAGDFHIVNKVYFPIVDKF